MDWRLFAATFATVFLAELGDKTQLATMSLAASGTSRWVVFAGSALALVTASAMAVLAGEAITRLVPPLWIRRGAAILFVALGVLVLIGGDDGPAGEQGSGERGADGGAG